MAISKISSSSIDPDVSLGDGFFKVDSTNNRIGIGTSSPASSLSFPIGTTPVISQVAIAGSAHSADNVGSLGLAISDGGGYSGVFVHNTHDGTFSSQDIRFLTAKGGNSVATERMRIDNSGRVTMPYQPAFQAYLGTSWTHGSGVRLVGGSWGTILNNGSHYNASTRRFTAPVSGMYAFNCTVATVGSAGGFSYLSAELWLNGSRRAIGGWGTGAASGSYGETTSSYVVSMNAGDYAELACESNKSFNLQGNSSTNGNTLFSGYLIG